MLSITENILWVLQANYVNRLELTMWAVKRYQNMVLNIYCNERMYRIASQWLGFHTFSNHRANETQNCSVSVDSVAVIAICSIRCNVITTQQQKQHSEITFHLQIDTDFGMILLSNFSTCCKPTTYKSAIFFLNLFLVEFTQIH